MAEKNQLQQLFTYDCWANKKIADILIGRSGNVSQKITGLFAHILASQQHWYHRIKGVSTTNFDLWPQNTDPKNDMDQLKAMHEQWLTLLKEKSGTLNDKITYQNSTKKEFHTPLSGILHHLIIHGQHHRAQIALLLRERGIEPPGTDFIFYLRQANV